MSSVETNVFPITNLKDLKSQYRLYRIRGLMSEQDEYDYNIQVLIGRLSRMLKSPVTVIDRDGQPYLVLRDKDGEPPQPFQLVRATAYFERTGEVLSLDYNNPTAETGQICIRFLQFAIGGALFNNPRLWQPSPGHPFYEREPEYEKDGIRVYRGYIVRVVPSKECEFGVCIDITYKYIAANPLPSKTSRNEFRKYKGTHCIYHYGQRWYEIKLHDHTGLSIKEQMIEVDTSTSIPVYDWIMRYGGKPLQKEVLDLSPDSSAICYLTARGEVRHAAMALCYPTYGSNESPVQGLHSESILKPHHRYAAIQAFVKSFLASVSGDSLTIHISATPTSIVKKIFLPPDLEFGNGTIYSVRSTPNTTYTSLDKLGEARKSALYNPKIGPYIRKQLDCQYFIIPQSVMDSVGPAFLKDLKQEVNQLYPQELPYDPIVIPYNDRVEKTFVAQGRAILEAVGAEPRNPGFGIVMIHETTDRRLRQHDQLAAMLMHKLRQSGFYVSVIHSTVALESYQSVHDANGPAYRPILKQLSKLNGYLRGVAINKVLLLNECWPFVLATPLHADLTIAIDVQINTACFTFMGRSGPDMRTEITISNDKEKLSKALVKKVILEVAREDTLFRMKNIRQIVIQRDGKIYKSETQGVRDALEALKLENLLPHDASVSFIEIHKKSAAHLRLFEMEKRPDGRKFIENPHIGSYFMLNSEDGYICTTGREFKHPGTIQPLHVKYINGSIPFQAILEDIYAQTCLALTRPEDCSRLPFTLKLTDIRLTEHAGGYDEDALKFSEEEYVNDLPIQNDEEAIIYE